MGTVGWNRDWNGMGTVEWNRDSGMEWREWNGMERVEWKLVDNIVF